MMIDGVRFMKLGGAVGTPVTPLRTQGVPRLGAVAGVEAPAVLLDECLDAVWIGRIDRPPVQTELGHSPSSFTLKLRWSITVGDANHAFRRPRNLLEVAAGISTCALSSAFLSACSSVSSPAPRSGSEPKYL